MSPTLKDYPIDYHEVDDIDPAQQAMKKCPKDRTMLDIGKHDC